MSDTPARKFEHTFFCASDLDVRRVINVLFRNKEQFAVIPNLETEGALISVASTAITVLQEEGILH